MGKIASKFHLGQVFLLVGLLFITAMPTTIFAATFCVDDLSDGAASGADCDADCTDGVADCSLRDAITAAEVSAGADDIDLTGLSGVIALTSDLPQILNSTNVMGPGADQLSIDAGAGNLRIFLLGGAGESHSISNLSLVNGGGALNGLAIFVGASTTSLTVDSCYFESNNATGGISGGAISNSGSTTVLNSTFFNNSSTLNDGGAIDNTGTLIVKNSTFSGNSAGDRGGAISNRGATSSTTLLNVTITGNQANGSAPAGGGIHEAGSGGTMTVQNSIIADNTDSGGDNNCDGTAISSNGNNIESGIDCSFISAGDQQNTDPVLADLADNGGPTTTHALLPGSPAIDAGNDTPTCTDLDINGEDQRGLTRCVDADGDGSTVDIGAFELQAFTVNSLADTNDFSPADGVCDTDDMVGDGPCTLRAAIGQANATQSPGPQAIHFSTTGTINTTSPLVMVESVVVYGPGLSDLNIDAGQGHRVIALASATDDQTFALSDMTITGGASVGTAGGVLLADGETLTLERCVIANNHATGGGGYGGGINTGTDTSLTIIDSTITGNSADTRGGGLGTELDAQVLIRNSTISGNTTNGTDSPGGGIYTAANITMDIVNSTISGNQASGSGGGIRKSGGGTIDLHNVTIFNNTADHDGDNQGLGGGLSSNNTAVNFENTIIAGNTDGGNGAPDCEGTLDSDDFNLVQDTTGCTINGSTANNITGQDPLLGVLADNGGLTFSHEPQANSPVVDAGNPSGCTDEAGATLVSDQRNQLRPLDGDNDGSHFCDMGAVEAGECGDGIVDPGEECDNGGANSDTVADACRTTCENPSCGDDVTDSSETCDDGNNTDSDGCQANCAVPTCGDGIVDSGEDCDNGAANNDTTADACRTTCAAASCGDGVVDATDDCDDGNANNDDGCTTLCVINQAGDLEDANPGINFRELIVNEAVSLTVPDPTEPLAQINAACTCAWQVSPTTQGTFSAANQCETDFTPTVVGDGTLLVNIDCGGDGIGNFFQFFTAVTEGSGTGGASSSGGCSLQPSATTQPFSMIIFSIFSLFLFGIMRKSTQR